MNEKPTKLSSRRVPIAIILGLTLFSGVVHGYLDGRWASTANLQQQGSRLGDLPESCGDWMLVETTELPKGAADLLRCHGAEVRVYRNKTNDATINAALLFGPRGPIAVHTPEICYNSVGTEQTRKRQIESVNTDAGIHRLWSVEFSKAPDPEPSLEVWYAWSDGGPWEATRHPRLWMTDSLYKIQIAGPVGHDLEQPCRDFLKAFLPQVDLVIQ